MDAVKYRKGAEYKIFETLRGAVKHQNQHGFKHHLIRVHVLGLTTRLHDYCIENNEPEIPIVESKLATCFRFGYDISAHIKTKNGGAVVEFQQENSTLAMQPNQWYLFRAFTQLFEKALEKSNNGEHTEIFQHVGDYIFIELKSPLMMFDIKRWYPYENHRLKPDNSAAIKFRPSEWRHLLNIANQIENVLNEVSCGLKGTVI